MRLSLNTATVKRWTLAEAVAGCAAAGITGIGLWRDRVAEVGPDAAGKLVRDAGLTVTTLCRGGFFTDDDPAIRAAALADNRRAIEEAAQLGTRTLVLVCGGLPPHAPRDLPGARGRVLDAIGALVPHARAHGVRLAIEPLHPMFCSDRCVVSTLGQQSSRQHRLLGTNKAVTVPAEALTSRLHLGTFLIAVGFGIVLFAFTRWFWRYGLRHYSGASA